MKACAWLLLLAAGSARAACEWCVENDAAVAKEIKAIGKKTPAEQLAYVRAQKIRVKVLRSNRSVPQNIFVWASVETPTGALSEVTRTPGLMGKTLCADERPLAHDGVTIALADDAPRTTLLHEYLHTKQMARDPKWCAFSKSLWSAQTLTPEQAKLIRAKEWDVHRFLWKHRADIAMSIEDELTVASETVDEARQRQSYDPEAKRFVEQEKIPEFLQSKMEEFQRSLSR